MDVMICLKPLAQEMKRTWVAVMIIGHQGILRILYAFFTGLSQNDAPFVPIPLNHAIRLDPRAYSTKEVRTCLLLKEYILTDGQVEPVTSMPMMEKVWKLRVNAA